MSEGVGPAGPPFSTLLSGWADDDHAAALEAMAPGAAPPGGARAWFEAAFRPVPLPGPVLFTGYYEPLIAGDLSPSGAFPCPLYRLPPGPEASLPRAAIAAGALAGRGLEIAWTDPVEAFFLQIQGSSRIRLPDGGTLRLGYAGRNSHPYRSIGPGLVARGQIAAEALTAQAVKAWLRAQPDGGAAVMAENPSYVFFREIRDLAPDQGPIGTLGRPLTPLRSLAVDPAVIPLGSPVWVDLPGPDPIRGLMIAQDTGGAIRGPGRADIFFGTGAAAGARAGALRQVGRMVALLPRGG